MAFFKTDGLTSYNVSPSNNKILQLTHTTAYEYASTTSTSKSNVPAGSGEQIAGGSCLWFSADGTKLFALYTDFEYFDIDRGYMKQFSLSTAWDITTLNTTPTTTLTLPLGTRYPTYPTSGTALYSENLNWQGLEFADNGLSFYFIRYESDEYDNSYYPNATRAQVSIKCDYTLTTAWDLSTASLTSSTDIAISDIDYGDATVSGFVSMYHTMSGGELVVLMGWGFMNLDSISDTTPNFTSSLGSGGTRQWWWSEDETLLVNEGVLGGDCFGGDREIATNYVQATSQELDLSDGGTHVNVTNESTTSQSITYTWTYDSYTGLKPTVTYGGVNRSVGYTTPSITSTFATDQYPPFTFSGSGGTITFTFTILSATVDTIDETDASESITVNVL